MANGAEQIQLWGEEYKPEEESIKIKKAINRQPRQVKSVETAVKSKTISMEDKIEMVTAEVNRILGVYKGRTIVIKSRQRLHSYIDVAIQNGSIAIDTETNRSLDPLTCKLVGLCIYTPTQLNAYVPVNHVNRFSFDNERLDWQVTEQDIKEELERLNNTKLIYHNGKFDYQVLKCTCGVDLKIDWDTMIGARILDENEKASLKSQYISKIDPSIEKYDIEHLFQGIQYEVYPPELFALYAATDAYMTYKLYEWQKDQLAKAENKGLNKVFFDIEMPIVKITADMELTGVDFDMEYAKKLADYYHNEYDKLKQSLDNEVAKMSDIINKWKETEDAKHQPKIFFNPTEAEKKKLENKDEEFIEKVNTSYPYEENGRRYKLAKSKAEQLDDPINLDSNQQLAILLYDILGVEEGIAQKKDKDNPNKALRGVGEEIIKEIANKYQFEFCNMILENRGLKKLISTYVDALQKGVNEKDGRIHAHFNQLGADTGRFSSNEPNLQNIPSKNHLLRSLFRAKTDYHTAEQVDDNNLVIPECDEVLTTTGWKRIRDLVVGDYVCNDSETFMVKGIKEMDKKFYVSL